MKPRQFFYALTLVCVAAVLAFAQENADKPSTQNKKQKVAIVVPSAPLDEKVSLIEGRVSLVYDGDTLSVETRDGKIYSVWLKGIDAPESKQNYGKKARKALADLVEGKEVKVIVYKKGQYDRYIGNVYLNGEDVGLKQIEAGLAWHFKVYAFEQTQEERRKYAQAQATAQSARLGLWEDRNPVAPWEYRKDQAPEPEKAETTAETSSDGKNSETAPKTNGDRKYILGPRGGCYYVSDGGRKVYTQDKSLCAKP